MKKILLPLEETERSLKAVHFIKENYKPEDAELVLLMIDESLGYSVKSEAEAEAVREMEAKIDVIAESLDGFRISKQAAVGKAGVRICRAAKEVGADLVVMTKSSKEDMLNSIGSATEYVINNCPCDVLIVSEVVSDANAYRGLIYKTASSVVNLRGQLGDKQSECLLPSVNQDCIYHIEVTVGKIRFFHTAYNPDTRNWDLPPQEGQEVTLDIVAGESRDSRLGGAVFALYRQVDTVSGRVKDQYPMEGYEALTSDDEGLIPGITSGLPAGVYYLSEVAPPSGYKELEGDLVFTITGEGEVDIPSHVESADTSVVILNNLTDSYVSGWITSSESEGHKTYTITIPNELAGVPVRIIKIDQNGKALEGAQFSFTGEGISETGLVSSKEEGSDDALIYENPALLIGTYTLTETDPPAGFYPPEAPIIINVRNVQGSISVSASIGGTELDGSKVKFDSETGVWTIRITNRIGYELPSSGGLGTGLFTALGALLVLAAGLLLWRRRRAV